MIDINKKYKTRSGLPVRILCTDRSDDNYNIVVLVSISDTHERLELYTVNGKYFSDGEPEHYMDLVEVNPYDHIKVGDLVMCWNGAKLPQFACLRKYAGITATGRPIASQYNGEPLVNCEVYENCMLLEDYVKEFM